MVQLTLDENQVMALIRQLPPQSMRRVLLELAADEIANRDARMVEMESRFRALARGRNLDWDSLNDEQRIALIDELIHEGRGC